MGGNYTVPVGDWGTATLRGEYTYKSKVFFTPFEDDFLSQDGYSLFNARLTFEDADDRWTFAGWIKNISNAQILSHKLEGGFGTINFFIPPRTYGVTVGYKF